MLHNCYIPVFPILTDLIELTHRNDTYFVDYRIEINQIPMTVLDLSDENMAYLPLKEGFFVRQALNPSNTEATFIQSTRMQRFLKTI